MRKQNAQAATHGKTMTEQPLHIYEPPPIIPFWLRIPRFFLFPAYSGPLVRTLIWSTLFAFAVWSEMLLVFVPVVFVVLVSMFRYAYRVLEKTAYGHLNPNEYHDSLDEGGAATAYKQVVVFILLGVAGSAIEHFLGRWVAGAFSIFMSICLPAIVMTLAITHSIVDACNPAHWLAMIGRIGKSYLALLLFLFILSGGSAVAYRVVEPVLPEEAMSFVFMFVIGYFTLVMFNMMGYVLYQYHHMLGIKIAAPALTATSGKPPSKEQQFSHKVGQMVAEGNVATAIDAIYDELRFDQYNLPLHEHYHRLLLLDTAQQTRMLQHAQRFITELLRQSRFERAVEILQACLSRDATFKLPPEQILPMAQAAEKQRKFELAMQLMQRFDRDNPRHADIPGVYLLGAKIMCEHMKRDHMAGQIIQVLLERYPTHPLAEEARKLGEVIARLGARPASGS